MIERSILAGICISIGCIVYLKVGGTLGAFLFSLGLLTVIARGYDLYTGKTCRREWLVRPFRLCMCLMFNVIGCAISTYLFNDLEGIKEAAVVIVDGKLSRGNGSIFAASILCGILIAIAVRSDSKIDVIMAVMIFILAGAEHVIADAFYIFISGAPFKEGGIFLLKVAFGNLLGGILFSDVLDVRKKEEKNENTDVR